MTNSILAKIAKAVESERAAQDLELWKRWNEGGRKPEDLRALFDRFAPMLNERSAVFLGKGLRIPPAAIRAEFKKQLYNALQTYDPSKGASLGTHVYSNLRSATRFITTHQNLGRIPETRVFKVGKLNQAVAMLDEQLGRTPTDKELASFLKWKPKEVATLRRELRRDLLTSSIPADVVTRRAGGVSQAISFARKELSDRDVAVMERIMRGEKPSQIAKALGISRPTVSRSKARVTERLKAHLQKYGVVDQTLPEVM